MKKILLAEDDPFIIDIYANRFKQEGYAVDVAKDGEMALEKIRSNYPDLLVLDIMMPKMDGWELLRQVRNDEKIRNLKVIVMSNLDQKEQSNDIEHLGVIKYFLKISTTPEEITNAINDILQ